MVCHSNPKDTSSRLFTRSTAVRAGYSRLPPVTRPIDWQENPAIGVSLNPQRMLDGALLGTFTEAPATSTGHPFFSVDRSGSKPPLAIVRWIPVAGS